MTLRQPHLELSWEPLLTTEQISLWVSEGTKADLKKFQEQPGVYRWLFPSDDPEAARCYVGQSGDLEQRVSEYLNDAWRQIREAKTSENPFASAQELEYLVKNSTARYISPAAAKEALENGREVEVEERKTTAQWLKPVGNQPDGAPKGAPLQQQIPRSARDDNAEGSDSVGSEQGVSTSR